MLLLALRAGLDRLLLAAPGLDGDLVRLGPLGLRQHDADDAILERGVGLARVHLKRQRHAAPELSMPELMQVPGRALSLLALRRGGNRSREGDDVLVDRHFEILSAHAGYRRDDDRFVLSGVDVERQWSHCRSITTGAS